MKLKDKMQDAVDALLNEANGSTETSKIVAACAEVASKTIIDVLVLAIELENKKRFEEVDLGDLKNLYPGLNTIHLTVDTSCDLPEDWYIIGMEKR